MNKTEAMPPQLTTPKTLRGTILDVFTGYVCGIRFSDDCIGCHHFTINTRTKLDDWAYCGQAAEFVDLLLSALKPLLAPEPQNSKPGDKEAIMCDCIERIELDVLERHAAASAQALNNGIIAIRYTLYRHNGTPYRNARYEHVDWKYCPFCGQKKG